MRQFAPRTEILPAEQKRLWPELRPAQELGYVLYGGTSVALRLGHRSSVDFDFFSERPLTKEDLRKVLPFTGAPGVTVLQDEPNAYVLLTAAERVKVSFFGGIAFGRVGEPEITNDGVLQAASLDDLIALKLKVILDRVEAKDYRDIAAMISAGMSLERGLSGTAAFYGSDFSPAESLKALVHFKGGDLEMLTSNDKRVIVDAVRSVRTLPPVFTVSKQLSA
jgi:hypothetical protein